MILIEDAPQSAEHHTRKSRYYGVRYKEGWIAVSSVGIRIGRYDTEVHAAMAYDHYERELFGDKAELNFPRVTCVDPRYWATDIRDRSARYRGVSFAANHGRWQAQLTTKGIRSHLGYFDTPEAAAYAVARKERESWLSIARRLAEQKSA